MNVNQVLDNTLSPDANIRGNAEQQLEQAAQQNFSEYLSVLSQALAKEDASSGIRQAAGLALKNALSYKDANKSREVHQKWRTQVDPTVKQQIKNLAMQTFASNNQAAISAAQLVATIAAIELPQNEWPDLMTTLVNNVGSGVERTKMSSLTTIGFICESDDSDLRESLTMHSNAILTAVVQGARKEETNQEVRFAALQALSDATEFIRSNFENEGERNYIMQVVCEATQSPVTKVQAAAFGCLNRIMGIYYDKMRFYMEKALFGLTITGMRSSEEDVAKLAIEFWCTVCEEEISIEDDNSQAQAEGSNEVRQYFNFARVAASEVVPVLLHLMTLVEEDAQDDDYNVPQAAYQCLQLYAQTIGSDLVPMVLQFVEVNLRSKEWGQRDAAVAAFGAIMDGPEIKVLDPLVKQALPVLIGMMQDPMLQVRDSAAFALSRVCDYCYESIDVQQHLQPLMQSLFEGLMSNPKMASSCCLALLNLAERFVSEDGAEANALTPHFQDSVTALLQVTEKADTKEEGASQVRTAAYEVLGGFITNAANASLNIVNELISVIIERMSQSLAQQKDVVSVEDKMNLEEKQISLASVLLCIVQRLEAHIAGQADRVMQICIETLNATGTTAVPEVVFQIVSGLCNALGSDFLKYMDSFVPYLNTSLRNQDAPDLCSLGIGLVSDIVRALEDKAQPYCDQFMNDLLNNLRSDKITNQLKPPILETFGDIASNIGPSFETYLTVVAQVLQQASQVTVANDVSYDMIDYIISLRSGIADAWDGIIVAFKGTQRVNLLQNYATAMFQFLQVISVDTNHNEGLLRACMGIIGDLGEAFPDGQLAPLFQEEWVTRFVKETRAQREFSTRTINAARWAREMIKRQPPSQGGSIMNSS